MDKSDGKNILKLEEIFNNNFPFIIKKGDFDYPWDRPGRKPHIHEFIEIAYVYEGKGYHYMGGKNYEVGKGDIFIINYDVEHCFTPIDNENSGKLGVFNCAFLPEFIENLKIEFSLLLEISKVLLYNSIYSDEKTNTPYVRLTSETLCVIDSLFKRMYREFNKKETGYIDILKLHLYDLLINLYRCYESEASSLLSHERYKYQLIYDAIKYLKQHYSGKIKLDDISGSIFLSKNYFSRLFKEATGVSVFDYIQKLRINKACELLLNTMQSIK